MNRESTDEYKRPYLLLFNAVSDALRAMETRRFETARDILIEAQQRAEDAYIDEVQVPPCSVQ